MRSLVTSIFLYACESWNLTAELQGRTQAMEMRCYRKKGSLWYREEVLICSQSPEHQHSCLAQNRLASFLQWKQNFSSVIFIRVYSTSTMSLLCMLDHYSYRFLFANGYNAQNWPILQKDHG